jgi:hypothetical protein
MHLFLFNQSILAMYNLILTELLRYITKLQKHLVVVSWKIVQVYLYTASDAIVKSQMGI